MKKNVVIIATMFLAASTAFAGMGGGGMGGGSQGMPGRPGGTTGQMPGAMGNGMSGMDLTVADDGTVFTIRRTPGDPEVPASGTVEVVAISPTGGILWTWATVAGVQQLELAGDMVLVSSSDSVDDHEPGTPQGGMGNGSVLHALAIHSGAELWQISLEGWLMNLEPAGNVIYALVADPAFGTGTTTGEIVPRGGMHPGEPGQGMGNLDLVAVSLDGSILWTTALNQ